MHSRWQRSVPPARRVALLVLAVTLPSAVIVALGLRLLGQERELAENRIADQRRQLVAEVLAAHARFALARALARAGRQQEADALNVEIAAQPLDVTDEYGIPLAMYAAQRLADRDAAQPAAFLARSLEALAPERWPSPAACYALQQITPAAARSTDPPTRAWAPEMKRRATRCGADAEHVLALQNDISVMLPRRGTQMDEPRWFMTGSPAWLVSVTPVRPQESLLIAVDAERLTGTLPAIPGASGLRLVTGSDAGEPLGDLFPGIRLSYAPADAHGGSARARLQQWFYLAALAMVLALTGLGVFLLWRDVRREMRAGALRAQFVASVSHELKTPLTSIRMFAETLRMGRGLDEGARAEYLDTIINESERLTRLLNNVLDFSRIEQDRKAYRLVPVDLSDVIRTAARTIEYPLAQERFELHLALDEMLPPVQADPDAIQQAVLNLLTNAMKYSGASRCIELSLAQADGAVMIAVTDHGPGIAANDQARLFERFYRAQTLQNQHIPGTGLGLTIVQHIAEAHGGTVAVESVPGKGSAFRITLPIPAASASVVPAMSEVRP
ncbi:MAG: HAMP domain-containing histidine kinase [Acidobacteria bacterium]|nr:HAMP domain-containing histidine kinase [Acidobacteriota bacterium]